MKEILYHEQAGNFATDQHSGFLAAVAHGELPPFSSALHDMMKFLVGVCVSEFLSWGHAHAA